MTFKRLDRPTHTDSAGQCTKPLHPLAAACSKMNGGITMQRHIQMARVYTQIRAMKPEQKRLFSVPVLGRD